VRLLLLTGKGGVGKTTVAAATAVTAARSGCTTLVVSTDAAHSLGDALDRDLSGGEAVEIEPGLTALQVDVAARAARELGGVRSYLRELLQTSDVADPALPEVLDVLDLPGALDVLTLLTLREEVAAGRHDLVVVDCAPTAETLRLLALPETLTRLVDRVLGGRTTLTRALGPALGRATGLPLPAPALVAGLLRLRRELAEAVQLLSAPTTSVRLVLTPERVVLAEARRTLTALALHGVRVDGAIANRVLPGAGCSDDAAPGDLDEWRGGWVRAQRAVLASARSDLGPVPLTCWPYLTAEPVGADALHALGSGRVGDVEALLRPVEARPGSTREPRLRVRPDGGVGYLLEQDLPLASVDDVDLTRRGDELVLAVAGHRRALVLPSVLRRCTVAGATLADGVLTVRFERDLDLWPAERTS
jgi:arsenite-transporting ATPase